MAKHSSFSWRVKSIDSLVNLDKGKSLHRSLSSFDLVLLGIGCIIGTGIFVLTGVAAAEYSGPAITLSFVLSGIACAFAALVYAEMSSMIPVSGSAYTYSYASLGEFAAWLVGWNLVLEYAVSAAAVASGWSGYFTGILKAAGYLIPEAYTKVPQNGGIADLPAAIIVLFITAMLIIGTKKSARFNTILVLVKLSALFVFLWYAVPNIDPANWTPFFHEVKGWQGMVTGAAIIFFAYIGFDSVSTAAEEAKNPQRAVPIGLIGSLIICTILYIVVAGALTGIVPYQTLNNSEPLAFALRQIGNNFGSVIVATGAIAGITTVLLVLIYGQTRIFFVMGRDRMLPMWLSKLHPRFHTPYIVTIITGIFVSLVAAFAPIQEIAELSNIGTLFAFIMVAIAVLVLRVTQPNLKRPFRTPWVWFVGIGAVLSCGYLMISLPLYTWERFVIWSAIGAVIYFAYGYRKSPLSEANKPAPVRKKSNQTKRKRSRKA